MFENKTKIKNQVTPPPSFFVCRLIDDPPLTPEFDVAQPPGINNEWSPILSCCMSCKDLGHRNNVNGLVFNIHKLKN